MSRFRMAQAALEPDFPQPTRSWHGPVGFVLRAAWLAIIWFGVVTLGGYSLL